MPGRELSLEAQQARAAQLDARIQFWDNLLEHAESSTSSPLYNTAVKELDGILNGQGLLGKACLVYGEGNWCEPGSEAADHEVDLKNPTKHSGEVSGKLGVNYGFQVVDFPDEAAPKTACKFLVDRTFSPHPTLEGDLRWWLYVKAKGMWITPFSAYEAALQGEVSDEALAAVAAGRQMCVLNRHASKMMHVLKSPDFLERDKKSQLKTVDYLLRQAETESGVLGSAVVLENAAFGCVTDPEDTTDVLDGYVNLQGLCLGGLCWGLTALERAWLYHRPIRSDKDLFGRFSGLSLSVELDKSSGFPPQSPLKPGAIVKVPISGQQFEAIFEPGPRIREILETDKKEGA